MSLITPLKKLKVPSHIFGTNEVYIKDESKNPNGIIDDRKSVLIIEKAKRRRVDKLVTATTGNAGFSLGKIAKDSGIVVCCVVNKSISKKIKSELSKYVDQIFEVSDISDLRTEKIITITREKEDEVIWDVSVGYEEAFGNIISEIQIDMIPDYIVVPVTNGSIFIGLIEEIKLRRLKTKVLGVSSKENNGVSEKLFTKKSPYEKALNYYSNLGHKIYNIGENDLKTAYKEFGSLVKCEPVACSVFCIKDLHDFKSTDKIVLVNIGKGLF